jgi:MFS transporter, ACS family, solute carrier family 17 (sodium-dependent inorganic phosphate cotransporter), other
MRVNLSVAIVAMTENRTIIDADGDEIFDQDFHWDSTVRGNVLSSFFYGYITTQFIGGVLGFKYGGNLIFGLAIGITAILTLFTPFAAKQSFYLLIAVRIIMGIFEGVTFPCMYDVYSNWSPKNERSRMVGFAISGNYFGTVLGLFLSGIFTSNYGWESVFYIFGIIALIWCVIWLSIVKRNPREDNRITENERQYILINTQRESTEENFLLNWTEIPWKSIFTSLPVWAIIVAHFCESWGFFTMFTELPSYMNGNEISLNFYDY